MYFKRSRTEQEYLQLPLQTIKALLCEVEKWHGIKGRSRMRKSTMSAMLVIKRASAERSLHITD